MISFRYHLSTLVAVFLALAIGVVLGGGPLSEWGRSEDKPADTKALAAAQERGDEAEAALTSAAPTLYRAGLKDRTVTVLRLPGVSEATVESVVGQIKQAQGTAQVWEAGPALVGPGDKALVDTLGAQLADQLPADLITPEASTYVRMGEIMGVALASTKPAGDAGNATTGNVMESLQTAKLLTGPQTAENRAPLVLVLAADPDLADGVDAVHEGLVTGLRTQSVGVVVATSSKAPLADDLREAKVTDTIAVLDGVETSTGAIGATMALIRSLNTPGGSFGVTGADGTLPLL